MQRRFSAPAADQLQARIQGVGSGHRGCERGIWDTLGFWEGRCMQSDPENFL